MKGQLYIISNPSIPGMVKIGMTTRDVETRIRELYTTGLPTEFKVEYVFLCEDVVYAEKQAHRILEKYRVNKSREWFAIDAKEAAHMVFDESVFEKSQNSFIKALARFFGMRKKVYAEKVVGNKE